MIRLSSRDTATIAEIFHIPDDYPMVECEDGSLLPRDGWYWWYVMDDGCPDTYPSGPFGSSMEALADWDAAGSWETVEEE